MGEGYMCPNRWQVILRVLGIIPDVPQTANKIIFIEGL